MLETQGMQQKLKHIDAENHGAAKQDKKSVGNLSKLYIL